MAKAGGHRSQPDIARVRRFEAAGFRAWPATKVDYDGTWVLRLTPGLAGKRLNSVNPLDPHDDARLPERVTRAAARFRGANRVPTFRITPLAPPKLITLFENEGWTAFGSSIVMSLDLAQSRDVDGAMDQIPLKDLTRFVRAAVSVRGGEPSSRSGLADVIASIKGEAGLFVLEQGVFPLASAICVHDGDLAGLFEVATAERMRRQGLARRMVLSALKWAKSHAAHTGWLQVEADNEAALTLYRSLGFNEVYRYHYRQPPERPS